MMLATISEEILNKLAGAESEEEVLNILKETNVSFDDAAAFIQQIQNDPAELSEADLDDVSGGGYLHNVFARTAYRIKHKKLFVKTSVDPNSRTITVTNRFGKKVSETYMY